jgi:hypothetical protein
MSRTRIDFDLRCAGGELVALSFKLLLLGKAHWRRTIVWVPPDLRYSGVELGFGLIREKPNSGEQDAGLAIGRLHTATDIRLRLTREESCLDAFPVSAQRFADEDHIHLVRGFALEQQDCLSVTRTELTEQPATILRIIENPPAGGLQPNRLRCSDQERR